MNKLSRVVLVGRTNVGKSTLFNRLAEQKKSITFDFPGVTRDIIKDTVCWNDRCFELVDTGGISIRKTTDPIAEQVRKKALGIIEDARLVLFVVDGTVGLVQEDHEIAKLLHKMGKKVLLIINKSDVKATQEHAFEFDRLGFEKNLLLSAQHGSGIGDLLHEIVVHIPISAMSEEEPRRCHVVLLGKPNVGKSSLMNLLVKEERSIVAPIPGTTREAVSQMISFNHATLEVTDTAGVRRKRGVTEALETLMVKSSLRAVDQADIVLLLVDASAGVISDQELKLAFYVFQEQYKALIFIFNKNDLMTELLQQDLEHSLELYPHLLKKIPQLTVSCLTGKNVGKILPLVQKVWERYNQRFSNEEITYLLKQALEKKPLYHKTVPLILKYAEQIGTAPITIALKVNVPKWFGPSQLAFFEHCLRDAYELQGVPIKFVLRKGL